MKVIPFIGYGDNEEVVFLGRVVEDNGYADSAARDGLLNNLVTFWKRYSLKPITGVKIKVIFGSEVQHVQTNEYGLFECRFSVEQKDRDGWISAAATINDREIPLQALLDSDKNDFGVISDIDDTILVSHATDKIRLIWLTVFGNARSRNSFPGATDFYQRLVLGPQGNSTNPIFYVSSSHWRLYDMLIDFLEQNNFPPGPLFLKRVNGWIELLRSVNKHRHKEEKIKKILELYQDLDFILVGDSGQKDAAIYTDIALNYPDRIKAIYIRDVTLKDNSLIDQAITKLEDTPLILFSHTSDAIADAIERGFVSKNAR